MKGLFRLYFRDGRTYRIRFGPLRGLRWRYHKGHPFWMPLGQYEPVTADWLDKALSPGDVFYDIGAHAGYFTLLGSRAVGGVGHVVAFEPLPTNRHVLNRQLSINGVDNVTVVETAINAREGSVRLCVPGNLANAHLHGLPIHHVEGSAHQVLTIDAERLDTAVGRIGREPDLVKVDVEGAEEAVLRGATRVLDEIRPRWLIATHSPELGASCRLILEDAGYSVRRLAGFEHELIAEPQRR